MQKSVELKKGTGSRPSSEKRVYTLAEHKAKVAQYQQLVDLMLPIIKKLDKSFKGTKQSKRFRRLGQHDIAQFDVQITIPFEGTAFLLFYAPSLTDMKLAHVEYRKGDKVADSAQFKGDKYLGTGHIQASGLEVIDLIVSNIKSEGKWVVVD